MNKWYQKGNIPFIVLALVVAIGVGGYFIYNQKVLNSDSVNNSYTLATSKPLESSNLVSTSDEITLTITSPINGAVLTSGVVKVVGKTLANADVFVNDLSVKADTGGNFTLTITLDEGENQILVVANDDEGNVAEQTLSVNVQTF